MVKVISRIGIELQFLNENNSLTRIYDGPGILSPVILPEPNATHVMFSSYQGFVTYYAGLDHYDHYYNQYDAKNHPYRSKTQILKWFNQRIYTYGCENNKWHKTLRGTYGGCVIWDGIVTIHQMLFIDYNMVG